MHTPDNGRNRSPFRARRFTIVALIALSILASAIGARAGEGKTTSTQETVKLPRLVDLGRGTCIPCKKMMPIIDELKETYADVLEVEYVDVGEDPEAARKFAIRLIPTQVFLSPEGKELYRHQGFYSKEAILKRWKKLGYELKPKGKKE